MPCADAANLVLTCTTAEIEANVTWPRLPEHGLTQHIYVLYRPSTLHKGTVNIEHNDEQVCRQQAALRQA